MQHSSIVPIESQFFIYVHIFHLVIFFHSMSFGDLSSFFLMLPFFLMEAIPTFHCCCCCYLFFDIKKRKMIFIRIGKVTLYSFSKTLIQFRTKPTLPYVRMYHLIGLFLQSITINISELIDQIDTYPTKFQQELLNEDILKSLNTNYSLINCTKTISYRPISVSSNNPSQPQQV